MELEKLKRVIEKSLNDLYKKDYYLICHRDDSFSHGSERGIVFRFGIYFNNHFKKENTGDNNKKINYSIDTEYNRNINDKKILPGWKNGSYPDFIVHERGNNDNNLLILEFKTWWNNNQSDDEKKIKQFLNPKGNYKYQYGATILIEKEGWIVNGFTSELLRDNRSWKI